jgi:hypothetical protein
MIDSLNPVWIGIGIVLMVSVFITAGSQLLRKGG